MAPRQGYRRGYPVALLAGLEERQAFLWQVYSKVVKPAQIVNLNGSRNDSKALYNFHEAIIDALRPTIKEGVKSIILASPARTFYSEKFLEHVKSHHTWLIQGPNKAAFSQLTGSAANIPQVTLLARNPEFNRLIGETNTEENDNLIGLLEKKLNNTGTEQYVLYSYEEIEDQILGNWKTGKPRPEYLLLTDNYFSGSKQKGRLQRILAVATNRQVKTRIVKVDTPAGKRLAQLGGFVCLQKIE